MMYYQQSRGGYNEIIISTSHWPEGIVEAIFETEYNGEARAVHADYLAAHPNSPPETFPLVRLNLWGGGPEVFSAAPD